MCTSLGFGILTILASSLIEICSSSKCILWDRLSPLELIRTATSAATPTMIIVCGEREKNKWLVLIDNNRGIWFSVSSSLLLRWRWFRSYLSPPRLRCESRSRRSFRCRRSESSLSLWLGFRRSSAPPPRLRTDWSSIFEGLAEFERLLRSYKSSTARRSFA